MCIIVTKTKNGRLPKEKELKSCFNYNSDGAGFMYVDNNKNVIIDKGYMTFDKFYKQYKHLLKKYNNFKNKSLVIHFRIGTSSGNTPQNTHPYPITNKENYLHKLYFKTDLGIVHNGIIRDYDVSRNATINDTQNFIMNYLYELKNNWFNFYKNKNILKGIENITNSKFTILDTNDDVYFIGDFIEDNKLYFSNNTYKYDDFYCYDSYYNYNGYKYNNKYYTPQTNYGLSTETKSKKLDNLIKLESDYFVEYGANWEMVGERQYYWDFETLDLYEKINNKYELIHKNCYCFDENYCELFY